jgi:hypothetical protein
MQQADGWLEISAATGERGWLAAALFDLHSGDVGSLPQAELPPLAQVPTQAPVPTDPPVAPAQSGAVLRLEDSAFTGGFRNKGASVYGGRTATWVYGQGSGYSSMAATFIVDQAAPGVARLTIEGMDSEDRAKSPLRIGINGITLFEGASPFPNDDLPLDTGRWAALPLEFDAASLRPGVNTITITNLSQGTVGLPPFVALDYVVIELP